MTVARFGIRDALLLKSGRLDANGGLIGGQVLGHGLDRSFTQRLELLKQCQARWCQLSEKLCRVCEAQVMVGVRKHLVLPGIDLLSHG